MATPFLSLARKWRPRQFADLVGHEHTTRVLQNAARQNRLHHAFLFTGTRGVGKTTLARILAMLVNCTASANGEPCLQCDACQQIAAGRFLDVVELDAASHTKVDEMRELLESAGYAPVQGKCKVFIIDEVHMLSRSAFAAMLKTLEEPPAYLKFILATTDPQKLPATILSRCLSFGLRPLDKEQIAGRLRHILDAEKCRYDEAGIQEIARLASGSMRDALSILDQALAHGEGLLDANGVRRLSGQPNMEVLGDILRGIAAADVAALSGFAVKLAGEGVGFDAALGRLAALIYQAALLRVAPNVAGDEPEEAALIKEIAALFDDELLQALYEIAVRGRSQLPLAPDEQTGFDMTLLRMMLFAPSTEPAENNPPPAPPVESPTDAPVQSSAAPAQSPAQSPVDNPAQSSAAPAQSSAAPAQSPADNPVQSSANTPAQSLANSTSDKISWLPQHVSEVDHWAQITQHLRGTARALAEICLPQEWRDDGIVLAVDKSHQNGSGHLLPELERQLRALFAASITVTLQENNNNAATQARLEKLTAMAAEQPFVRDILQHMPEAQIVPNSIRTNDKKELSHD